MNLLPLLQKAELLVREVAIFIDTASIHFDQSQIEENSMHSGRIIAANSLILKQLRTIIQKNYEQYEGSDTI